MTSEPPVLETPRLLLRAFRAEDAGAYAAMCADAEVMRWLGGTLARGDAWRQMAMFAGHWTLRGYGTWAVEERASGAFAGRVGLHFPDGWPERELGWTLARAFWGKGFAFEAARAALDHAFGALGWPRVASLIHPDNARSIRLAARLGMRHERDAELRGHAVRLYALERAWIPGPAGERR